MQNLFAGKVFKNRGGAIIAAVAAAVLATILLIVYLNSYRSSVNSGKRPERVLVATALIPRGTSGALIAQKGLYQVTSVQKDQLKNLAISDPGAIGDRVAAADIFPGQQLTQDEFSTEAQTSIPYQITGAQRAIAVPVDAVHGLTGQVATGDFVDIYVGISGSTSTTAPGTSTVPITATQVKLLAADVLVLVAPGAGGANAVIRVKSPDVAKFAYVADNERFWFVLRPRVGATKTPPATATLGSLLAGGK